MIETRTLKQIVNLMVENGLTEIQLEDGQEKVHLRRGPKDAPVVMAAPVAASPVAETAPAPTPIAEAVVAAETIDSPMVGTFYTSSSPDAAVFVKEGDKVSADTVVCIIEAMKVFNEIKAGKAGTIARICVENGTAVEFGQPLFELK